MRYERFEWLTIGVGAAAIFATLAMNYSAQSGPAAQDMLPLLFAQLLLLGVLISAVHWGRKGGFTAALAATVVFMVMRVPSIVSGESLADNLQMVIIYTVSYGIVGVLGGEMCSRIKYFFARLEDAFNIDEDSRVYNQQFLAQHLSGQLAQVARYDATFGLAIFTLSPNLTVDLRPAKVRSLVRTVANHIRDDVRLVDDVARLDDGRFVIVLPHTPKAGAVVASERVRAGVRDALGAKDESVAVEVYATPEDIDAITSLADSLSPRPGDESPKAVAE